MEAEHDLIVVGAGPAGTACAITAARAGGRVLLLDKDHFPRHKVCGEFVSAESLRLLSSLLGDDRFQSQPEIAASRIFLEGKTARLPVLPPARSIPRFNLDAALLHAAKRAGVQVQEETTVREVQPGEVFTVMTAMQKATAKMVVNATGRWSQLTQLEHGQSKKSGEKWIGLKAHFSESAPPNSVDLYFFPGGYCGVQPVSKDAVNACAMVHANAATSLEEVFALHLDLWWRSRDWEQRFSTVTTSALHFREPHTQQNGMLLAGDAAAFIDPFAGDGISLALHSGALAAQSLQPYLQGKCILSDACAEYRAAYFKYLAPALRNAARLRKVLAAPAWLRAGLLGLAGRRTFGALLVRGTRARV